MQFAIAGRLPDIFALYVPRTHDDIFAAVLDNPLVPETSREAIIGELGARMGLSDAARNTLRLLAKKRRLAALPDIARQLARLNVDVIEAGFPVISKGDFEAVQQIATEIQGPIIAGLARCVPGDIDAAGAAVAPAGERGRIHVFVSSSEIHLEHQMRKQRARAV